MGLRVHHHQLLTQTITSSLESYIIFLYASSIHTLVGNSNIRTYTRHFICKVAFTKYIE
jgi:hypothetical protein